MRKWAFTVLVVVCGLLAMGCSARNASPPALDPSKDLTGWVFYGSDIWNGSTDGPCAYAKTHARQSITVGPDGSLYFVDDRGLRRMSPDCELSTVEATVGKMLISSVAFDAAGNRYEAVRYGNLNSDSYTVRRVSLDGNVTLLVGVACSPHADTCQAVPPGDPIPGRPEFPSFKGVKLLTVDGDSLLFVSSESSSDGNEQHLNRLRPDGSVGTVIELPASVGGIEAVAVDSAGTIYVADHKAGVIRIPEGGTGTVIRAGDPGGCLAIDARDRLWFRPEDEARGFEVLEDGKRTALRHFTWPDDRGDPGNRRCGGMAFRANGNLVILEMGGDGEIFFVDVWNTK